MPILDSYDGKLSFLNEASEFLEQVKANVADEESYINDQSQSDDPNVYGEIAEEEYFLGEYPYSVLVENITSQFSNYISTDDRTNYVELFYEQLHASELVLQDEEEEHPDEVRELLQRILDNFNSTMFSLFRQRLTLTIVDFEDGSIEPAELEVTIRLLYEYFILQAKDNFRNVISKDIASKLPIDLSDDEFYKQAEDMIPGYSPIMYAVGPQEFRRLSNATEDLNNLFDSNKVVGNFLRRYSPRLFENEDFQVDILAHVAVVHGVKGDFINAYK